MEFPPQPIVRFQQEADLLKKHDRSMATGQEPAVCVAKEDFYVATWPAAVVSSPIASPSG